MSNPGDDVGPSAHEALANLENAVGSALARLHEVTRRAEEAEKRSEELNELMRRFVGNPDQAGDMLTRLKDLEDENGDLRERLRVGREGVERLMARVRFLEDQR